MPNFEPLLQTYAPWRLAIPNANNGSANLVAIILDPQYLLRDWG